MKFNTSNVSNMTTRYIPFKYYLTLLIVCVFAFFANNSLIPADLMESRNLATAQEMVRYDNYLTPTLNGDLRLEKPPLPTWIAAAVEHIVPDSIVMQRAMAGLAATAMAVFLLLLVARLTKDSKTGLISSLVLVTTYSIVFMGRNATWDIYCHSFMLGAIYFLVAAFDEKGKQWIQFLLAGLFLGLSFLSKGPVSIFALLLPFLISYIIIFRPNMKGKILPLLSMILLFLVVSFWWPIYIMMFHHELAISVLEKEATSWVDRNVRPFYYYWKFPAEAGIWALFWVSSIVYYFWKGRKQEHRKVFLFSILWLFISLVFLSCIPEKKTRYLLPILIPGAINIGMYIFHSIKGLLSPGEKVLFKVNATVIGVILLVIPIAIYALFVKDNPAFISIFIVIVILSLALAVFMFISIYAKGGVKVMRVFTVVIFAMMMVESLCIIPIGDMFINEDRHSIRLLRENDEVKNLPFFHNGDEFLRMELVYESNRIIRPLQMDNDTMIYNNLPFLFISQAPVDSLFVNQKVVLQQIGVFDNNWRKSGTKRHSEYLVSYVAIIRAEE